MYNRQKVLEFNEVVFAHTAKTYCIFVCLHARVSVGAERAETPPSDGLSTYAKVVALWQRCSV